MDQVKTGNYYPPAAQGARGAENIMLIYTGHYANEAGRWSVADAMPYVAYSPCSPSERVTRTDWFFDTYLYLGLQAPSGRAFDSPDRSEPARKEDWQWYMDHLFTDGQQIDAFEHAVAQGKAEGLGPATYRGKVIIMIPNPITTQQDFGDVDEDGVSLNFTTTGQSIEQAAAARVKAVLWYVRQVMQRWQAKQYQHLELIGFYWVEEMVHVAPTERITIRSVAHELHTMGHNLFWIPWFNAPGTRTWHDYGFDVVIHQPNFMFDTSIPAQRLKEAANVAKAYGMGVEIEADSTILSSAAGRERYLDYLRAGVSYGYMTDALKAYYQDAKALLAAYGSPNAEVRRMYDATYQFVKGQFRERLTEGQSS